MTTSPPAAAARGFCRGIMAKNDFREFLFMASGHETDPKRMSLLETVDNLNIELERLRAVAGLMESADADEADGDLLKSTGALVSEIHRRMHLILNLGFEANRSRPAAASRKRRKQRQDRKH
jgi:hypothetical protein